MNPAAHERLFGLLASSQLPDDTAEIVLAGADGPAALTAHLAGERAEYEREPAPPSPPAPPKAYLQEIAVEGFRGVGPGARLQFEAAPGLTLVVGRNGCGKSTFAEALEVLLTGTTLRWEERTRVWREGWRNLHHDGPAEVAARLRIDGEPGLLELNRRWAPGQALEAGDLNVTGARSSWAQLGWDRPLEQFRPLLSYNELGTMFSTRAAALYEALSAVLGLEDFDALLNTLRQERLAREKTGKDEKALRERVLAVVRGSEDPRAALLEPLILSRRPDLEDVSRHLESADVPPGSDPRALAALEVPTPEAVQSAFEGLAAARHAVERLLTGDSDRLDALAELLERGLTYHRHHGATPPADCPLCGTADAIDASWAQRTEAAAQDLRARSRELREARAELAAALNAAKTLFPNGIDTVLDRASEAGIDTAPALQAWQAWRETCTGDDAAVRDRGAQTATALSRALSQAREAAAIQIDLQQLAWRPVREAVGEWVAVARRAERDRGLVKTLKTAEAWIAGQMAMLRRERLAPVVDGAHENWSLLRHESNVALGGVELKKQGNQRFAAFDVAIDGSDASAFGVMSQGELSALAISVFLPRALLPGTPFGFVVIDDPVQSMDPAKVDGLARVLARAAEARQVIVFTHDERLPEAVRRLDIAARIMRIQRRARSKVEIVSAVPPSDRYIEEALAIARADELPNEVVRRVVPGFCRSAIEAACAARIRRRLVAEGVTHAEVDERCEAITSLNGWLAEALGLSLAQGREIRDAVRRLGGEDAVRVVDVSRRGAHEDVATVDALDLARGARKLVLALEGAA